MTHEYGDAITIEVIASAVSLTVELYEADPRTHVDDHMSEAIRRSVCACVTTIEDAIEGGASGLHAAVRDEVRRGVEARLGASGQR